jgi:hypothetical protein
MTEPLVQFLPDFNDTSGCELAFLLASIRGDKFLKFGVQLFQTFFRVRLLLRHHLDVVADRGHVVCNLPDISVDR